MISIYNEKRTSIVRINEFLKQLSLLMRIYNFADKNMYIYLFWLPDDLTFARCLHFSTARRALLTQ
jgi:hypothetical protein